MKKFAFQRNSFRIIGWQDILKQTQIQIRFPQEGLRPLRDKLWALDINFVIRSTV